MDIDIEELRRSCPGSTEIKQPKPEYIPCPNCGEEVEIWSDELKVTCPGCKKEVSRERKSSCIEWCKYAKECVGEEKFQDWMKEKS